MKQISHLALLAYVIGGWLLPASHFHTHHDHMACHVELDSAPADASSCCEHACCEADSDVSANASLVVFDGSSIHNCDGLCALCVARTLASTAKPILNHLGVCDDSDRSIGLAESTIVPPLPTREHLSRGPPVIV